MLWQDLTGSEESSGDRQGSRPEMSATSQQKRYFKKSILSGPSYHPPHYYITDTSDTHFMGFVETMPVGRAAHVKWDSFSVSIIQSGRKENEAGSGV